MSENVERLRGVYERWASGDFSAGPELWTQDTVFVPTPDGARPIRGVEAFMEYIADEFLSQWSEFRVEAQDFAEDSDTVVVTERQHATGRVSGIPLDAIFYATWIFRDGLVSEVRWEVEPPPA